MRLGKKPVFRTIASGVICFLFLLIGCDQGREDQELSSLSVRLTWLHQAQFAGLYLAKDRGFYAEEGLDVTLEPGGLENPSLKMVVAGSNDLGMTSADQILLAADRGSNLTALGAAFKRSPVVLFSIADKLVLSGPGDLSGTTIGIKYGDNTEVALKALLDRYEVSGYDSVSVSYDLSPLIEGRVDVLPGFAINEPIALREQGYEVSALYPADYGINLYADVFFTTRETIRERGDDIRAFMRATRRGYEYAITNPTEAVSVTLRRSDELEREHQRNMLNTAVKFWQPGDDSLFEMNRAVWVDLRNILLKQRLIKDTIQVDSLLYSP